MGAKKHPKRSARAGTKRNTTEQGTDDAGEGLKRSRRPQGRERGNDYAGFRVPRGGPSRTGGSGVVERVPAATMTDVRMWDEAIRQRRPIVLAGPPPPDLARAWETWTDDRLSQVAGGCKVLVERRSGAADTFGRGNRECMLFADFLKALRSPAAEQVYLTAQPRAVARDGHPAIAAPPLTRELLRDLPLPPAVMSGLALQSVNVWMGSSRAGSSSGLHHDFHDNLYFLIRGKKRFRMFSPDKARGMRTHGEIERVHPNGRVVYRGGGDVRADGASAAEVAAWERRRAALAAAGSDDGDDDALDDLLEAQLRDVAAGDFDDDYEEDSSDSGGDTPSSGGGDDGAGLDGVAAGIAVGERREDAGAPEHFSRIDSALLDAGDDAAVRAVAPGFPGMEFCAEVEIEAGDVLYMPAGWFHEVTSTSGAARDAAGHLAVNFWFHPPDSLAPGASGMAAAYSSPYWPSLWERRRRQLREGGL
ncbi:unnamed protein product [Pedinophyceae sp. YPF-701]|nr:unnamed protein product [Pedinophyceae sp. YPF-701]